MKVSVVMCAYNGQKFLHEQLSSIVKQTRRPNEIIICDDCSTDNSWAILKRFELLAPFAVRLRRNSSNIGVTANFESGLQMATGDIVFLCDQDDVWRSDKIESTIKIFGRDPEIGMVFTDGELVDQNMRPDNMTLWQASNITPETLRDFEQQPLQFLLARQNIITGAAAAFSRKVIKAALPFPKRMAVLHDAWLGQVAASVSRVKCDPRLLFKYRQHSSQLVGTRRHHLHLTRSHYEAQYDQLTALQYRFGTGTNRSVSELLSGNIAHLHARLSLPKEVTARFDAVVREASSGRYDQFSNGIRSAAKDVLLGV